MEQVIAEKKDPRRRYDRRMREQGFHKLNIWVKKDKLDAVKEFIRHANED